MPFCPELNYFFLYLQRYLNERHRIHVERGDHQILTQPIMNKIVRQITSADFLIADITSSNPNVFYELGVAHTLEKPVIFLTQDDPQDAPVDIRPYEFIVYALDRHADFLAKLDNAVVAIFTEQHQDLYNEALEVLEVFNRESGAAYDNVDLQEFQSRVLRNGGAIALPNLNSHFDRERCLLAKIVKETSEIAVMERITTWHQEG